MFGGGEEGRRVCVAEDGAQRVDQRAAQTWIVVTPEPGEQSRYRRGRARADQDRRGGLLDVHVRMTETCGDRGGGPAGPRVTQGEQRLPDGLDVLGGGQRDQGRRQRLRVVPCGIAGEQGDRVLAHVPVAVPQQAVRPRTGTRVGGSEQEFQQDHLLAARQSGPVQQIQRHGRDECVSGLVRRRRVEQAGRPDPSPLVEPAAQTVYGVQDLLGYDGLPGRLPAVASRGGSARLPGRRQLRHDAQEQVRDGRQCAGAAVGGQSAQCRHRLVRVQMGTQEGQFLLVRASEIRRDAGRQIGGVETDEKGAPL